MGQICRGRLWRSAGLTVFSRTPKGRPYSSVTLHNKLSPTHKRRAFLCQLYRIDDSAVSESRVSLPYRVSELASGNVNRARPLGAVYLLQNEYCFRKRTAFYP